MTNDHVMFEFINFDDREVLINARTVGEIANALSDAMYAIAPSLQQRFEVPGDFKIEVLLAGAQRGSLKTIFRFIFHPRDEDTARAKHWATLMAIATPVVGAGAWMLGVFEAEQPPRDRSAEHYTIAARVLQDPAVIRKIQEVAKAASDPHADEVRVYFPDMPVCRIATKPAPSVSMIGDLAGPAHPSLESGTVYDGPLELTGDTIEVSPYQPGEPRTPEDHKAHAVTLQIGLVHTAGDPRYVLVQWRARALPPGTGQTVTVRGAFHTLEILPTVTVLSDIPPTGRLISGWLNVEGASEAP